MLAPNSSKALEWIHSALGLDGDGFPADRPDLHGDLPRLGIVMGEMLAQVHSIPVDDAPLSVGWDVLDSVIDERAAQHLIDPSKLGSPYSRYGVDRLVEMWRDSRPKTEDLVVCCGSALLSSFLVKESRLAGLVDGANAIVADRHLDLAVAHQSVHSELGAEAVYSFYSGYGQDANIVTLDHYVLASRLLGLVG